LQRWRALPFRPSGLSGGSDADLIFVDAFE